MNFDYTKVENDLADLLQAMPSLSPSEVAEVRRFIDVNEYAVAFETLCGILIEEKKTVPAEARLLIRRMAEQMETDPMWWASILKEPA
jgi:hypothetical protein